MEALAADVLACAPPRFALAGLPMGGIVAMEVVRQAPDRVERLALLDTNPLAEQPEVKARRGPQIEAAAAGDLRRIMRYEMKPNYLAEGRGRGRDAILDLCMEMAMALGPEVFVRQSRASRAPCASGRIRRTRCAPTRVRPCCSAAARTRSVLPSGTA